MISVETVHGVDILCKGTGKQILEDVGRKANIVLAPSDAVRDALSINEAMDSSSGGDESIVLNFLGGDDLKIFEVIDAVKLMMEGMEMSKSDPKVTFNSLSDNSFPSEVCTVTAVSVNGGADNTDQAGGV